MGEASTMRRNPELTLVFVVTALAITAHYMATPLVPLAAERLGANTAGVGLASGIFALLPLLFAVPVGVLADRAGQGRVAVAGTLMMGATTLALLLPTFDGLVAAQALRGLGQVALMIGMQGFIAAIIATGPRRDTAYGSFVLAVSIGQLGGPALGGWVTENAGLPAAFTVSAGLAFVAVLAGLRIAFRRTPAGLGQAEAAPDLKGAFSLLRERPVKGAVAASCVILLQVAFGTSFYPVFLQHAGFPATAIGLLIALRGAGACFGRPLLPALLRVADDRWRLLRIVFVASCLGTLATPFVPVFWYQALIAVSVGVAAAVAQPITMAVVADHSGENRRSQAVALRVGANRLLQFVGPLAFGLLGEHVGLAGTFVAGGLVPLIGLLPLRGLRGRASVPEPSRV